MKDKLQRLQDLGDLWKSGALSMEEYESLKLEVFSDSYSSSENIVELTENITPKKMDNSKDYLRPNLNYPTTEPYAIACILFAIVALFYKAIIFVPMGLVCSFSSYYRIKGNPKFKGMGLWRIGSIIITMELISLIKMLGIKFFD